MKLRNILISALLAVSAAAASAIPAFAAEETNAVLAHWKFQDNPAYYTGDISKDELTFIDLSGNGNDLVTAVEGNGDELYVFEWDEGVNNADLTAKADKTALLFNNSLEQAQSVDPYDPSENTYTGAYTSGKYLETKSGAPLNSFNGEGGWTVEVYFKLSPDFNINYNRYTGIFSRQGVVDGQNEPPLTLAVTEPSGTNSDGYMGSDGVIGIQYVHVDEFMTKTNQEYENNTIPAGEWKHFMATCDGTMTDIYLDGEYISTITEDGSIFQVDEAFGWEVGVGRKAGTGETTKNTIHPEGLIRRLFCGTISEIRVSAGYMDGPETSLLFAPDVAPEPVVTEEPVVEEAPVVEEPAVEEPVVEEPVVEEPVAEEPAVEEPVAEEVVVEEVVVEEVVVEEPAAEETAEEAPQTFDAAVIAAAAAVISAAGYALTKKR